MIYRIVCCVIDTARIGQRSSVRLPVRPYVRLFHRSTAATAAGGLAPGRPEGGDIDRLNHSRRRRSAATRPTAPAARRSAANAGSVTLKADAGGRTQTCFKQMGNAAW